MSSESSGSDDPEPVPGQVQEFTVTRQNTFEFMPGPLMGISCPNCFKDQLLKEVVTEGECLSCGTDLQLTLKARTRE